MQNKTITTSSAEETEHIGEQIAKKVENGGIILLYGELGAGKTTFVKGLARGLGLTNDIISPTFILMRMYQTQKGQFYHIDLYRTESEKDIESIGLSEVLNDSSNIVVIEWPERLGENIPKKRIEIFISYKSDTERSIQINQT